MTFQQELEVLGDAPIEEKYRSMLNEIAGGLDKILNGVTKAGNEVGKRKTGFVLLVFPYEGHEGKCNYISNGASRDDVVVLMKELIARFEGQAAVSGNA